MSIDDVMKINMILEPAETRWEEAVRGSGVWSDGHRGEYLKIPLCVQAVSMSPVLAYAEVNLHRKCRKCLCARGRLSSGRAVLSCREVGWTPLMVFGSLAVDSRFN